MLYRRHHETSVPQADASAAAVKHAAAITHMATPQSASVGEAHTTPDHTASQHIGSHTASARYARLSWHERTAYPGATFCHRVTTRKDYPASWPRGCGGVALP